MTLPIDPTAFVDAVRPFLRSGDSAGLAALLAARWSTDQVASLMADGVDADARKVAALSLGLTGGRSAVDPLCQRLGDGNAMVRQMAEHALWSIWFRLGSTPAANDDLCRGARALADREFGRADKHFEAAIAADPTFAEAYNQRAIARYLRDDYAGSIEDCRRTVELMPCHFGAWAGMGHGHLHLGRMDDALRAYRHALAVHPHMEGVRQAAVEIRRRLRSDSAAPSPPGDGDD